MLDKTQPLMTWNTRATIAISFRGAFLGKGEHRGHLYYSGEGRSISASCVWIFLKEVRESEALLKRPVHFLWKLRMPENGELRERIKTYVLSTPEYQTAYLVQGLRNFEDKLLDEVLEELTWGALRYDSPHFNAVVRDLFSYYRNDTERTEKIDRSLSDIESRLLEDKKPDKEIDRQELNAAKKAFESELLSLKSRIEELLKNDRSK